MHADPHSELRQSLASVCQPIERARGMPNAAYTDPSLARFERDHVLGGSWAAIAFASDLPQPRWVKPVNLLGLPLLVMRDADQTIRVFHNVCSHRGRVLVEQAGECKKLLICPYHSWSYDLAGQLKATPHIGGVGAHEVPGFVPAEHGLREVRSAQWLGMVFVNLSGSAESFDCFIAPLAERWREFVGVDGLDELAIDNGPRVQLDVASNWKLAVENYCEAYHLPWVHPGLNEYSPLDQHYNLMIQDRMGGQGTRVYRLAEYAGISLPRFSVWPEDKLHRAEYVALYPNVLLGLQADHAYAMILLPKSAERTIEDLQLLYIGTEAASATDYAASRQAVAASWREVFDEDVAAIEAMQRGRHSPAFDGGAFSPVLDNASHHFHQWVAARYRDGLAVADPGAAPAS